MLDPQPLAFQPMEAADLPLLHRWLHQPHVARWWGPPPTLTQVEAKYLPRFLGLAPTCCYKALYATVPIGLVQTYRLRDYPSYAAALPAGKGDAGVDLFIGEPEYLHRGLGAPLLRKFLREVVFTDPEIEGCVLGPSVSNTPAIRCYQRAGFEYLRTVLVPDEPEPEYLMRITRASLADAPSEMPNR